jgi:copper chaperone CopZ
MDKEIKLNIPVLDITKKRTVAKKDIKKQVLKIKEEQRELEKKTTNVEYDGLILEALDVLQATINLVVMLHTKKDLETFNAKHNKKLNDRGWNYVGYSNLSIKYDLNQKRDVEDGN